MACAKSHSAADRAWHEVHSFWTPHSLWIPAMGIRKINYLHYQHHHHIVGAIATILSAPSPSCHQHHRRFILSSGMRLRERNLDHNFCAVDRLGAVHLRV